MRRALTYLALAVAAALAMWVVLAAVVWVALEPVRVADELLTPPTLSATP
ncbi:hypothetical protein ACTHAM_002346 [Cellulomonas soli]